MDGEPVRVQGTPGKRLGRVNSLVVVRVHRRPPFSLKGTNNIMTSVIEFGKAAAKNNGNNSGADGNMYTWEIMLFRFNSGEYAVSRARYNGNKDQSWTLFRPMTFVPNSQGGIGLVPFIPQFATDEKMIIPERNLFCEPMTPVKPLESTYIQATSNIISPSSLIVDPSLISSNGIGNDS